MRLIDADALIDRQFKNDISYNAFRALVQRQPTIDAVPVVHGEWKDVMTEPWCTFDECKCSVCGVVEYFNKGWKKFNYCPNCGAKMDGGKDDADE